MNNTISCHFLISSDLPSFCSQSNLRKTVHKNPLSGWVLSISLKFHDRVGRRSEPNTNRIDNSVSLIRESIHLQIEFKPGCLKEYRVLSSNLILDECF